MPRLLKSGKVSVSGAEQIAIVLHSFKPTERDKEMGRGRRALPGNMQYFERKNGGKFRYFGERRLPSGNVILRIRFEITNVRKFNRALRKIGGTPNVKSS